MYGMFYSSTFAVNKIICMLQFPTVLPASCIIRSDYKMRCDKSHYSVSIKIEISLIQLYSFFHKSFCFIAENSVTRNRVYFSVPRSASCLLHASSWINGYALTLF